MISKDTQNLGLTERGPVSILLPPWPSPASLPPLREGQDGRDWGLGVAQAKERRRPSPPASHLTLADGHDVPSCEHTPLPGASRSSGFGESLWAHLRPAGSQAVSAH